MKIIESFDSKGGFVGYSFYCPGCKFHHCFDSRWFFNGDLGKPTFAPSLLAKYPWGNPPEDRVCHSFVRDGKIQYLNDCTHEFAGKTIEMEEA